MADYSRPRRFVWFKYAFLCSWLIVVLAFTTLVTAAAALAALNTIASDICAEPEVASNSTSCRDRLKCFANCIDRIDAASGVVTSTRLRQCFLGDADGSNTLNVDDQCAYEAAQGAYQLAMRYRGSSVSYDNARYLMRQELGAADFAPPPSPPDGSGRRRIAATMSAMPTGGAPGFVVGAAMGFGRHLLRSLTVAPYRLIDSPTALTSAARAAAASAAFASRDAGAAASAAEGGARPRSLQQQQSQRLYAGAEADLYEAYTNVAVAAAIALVSSGTIAFVYGWLVAFALLAMLPSLCALRGLGNSPPRCCELPTHVERMHKVHLRCACHWSWLIGLVLLFLTALALTKFQIVLRYLTQRQSAIPSVWGYESAAAVVAPCVIGIIIGVFPVFYAMILSRSRAERREAMAADIPLKSYKANEAKPLTAPQPVLEGPPPNPAMLNPFIDPAPALPPTTTTTTSPALFGGASSLTTSTSMYTANYPSSGSGPREAESPGGASLGGASGAGVGVSTKLERV